MTDIWRTVQWSMGGNDRYGDCAFVALANLQDLWAAESGAPFTIDEAECELFYAQETGFIAADPATDRGVILEHVISDWCKNGWPADPLRKVVGYQEVSFNDFGAAIRRNKGLPCWAMLPPGDNLDVFSDTTLALDPQDGHAMLLVAVDATGLTLVTWAKTVKVSWHWWLKFGRQVFEVYRGLV